MAMLRVAELFARGDRVRVRAMVPPGHVRTPMYLRGKSGTIERSLGEFRNPEQLAYGVTAELAMLYRVTFASKEIWSTGTVGPDDLVEAELYAHWLEEAD